MKKIPLDFNELDIIFKVIVQPGSSLPKDKESQANTAMMMSQAFPEVFGPEFLAKNLEMGEDVDITPAQQWESLKQRAVQEVQNYEKNPQGLEQKIASGELPKTVLEAAMKDLQSTRQKVGQQAGGNGGQAAPQQPA
jgi:hypothetical protein